jgi:uncharacterized membrane protein
MKKDEELKRQTNVERVVTARSGLGVLAWIAVIWVVLRWIRHG